MIQCDRSFLNSRAIQRGYHLSTIDPCIERTINNNIIVDEYHPSYPKNNHDKLYYEYDIFKELSYKYIGCEGILEFKSCGPCSNIILSNYNIYLIKEYFDCIEYNNKIITDCLQFDMIISNKKYDRHYIGYIKALSQNSIEGGYEYAHIRSLSNQEISLIDYDKSTKAKLIIY